MVLTMHLMWDHIFDIYWWRNLLHPLYLWLEKRTDEQRRDKWVSRHMRVHFICKSVYSHSIKDPNVKHVITAAIAGSENPNKIKKPYITQASPINVSMKCVNFTRNRTKWWQHPSFESRLSCSSLDIFSCFFLGDGGGVCISPKSFGSSSGLFPSNFSLLFSNRSSLSSRSFRRASRNLIFSFRRASSPSFDWGCGGVVGGETGPSWAVVCLAARLSCRCCFILSKSLLGIVILRRLSIKWMSSSCC